MAIRAHEEERVIHAAGPGFAANGRAHEPQHDAKTEVEALRACEVGIGRPGNRDELAAALEDGVRFSQRVAAEAVHRAIIAREDLPEVPALVIHHHISSEERRAGKGWGGKSRYQC